MTIAEFSIEFDLLYNNIMSNMAPGLNEYEKSLFLTQAQEGLVLDIYKGSGSMSFESSEEATQYLQTLVKEAVLPVVSQGTYHKHATRRYNIPADLMYIVQDKVAYSGSKGCLEGSLLDVSPVTHDELKRVIRNPFRGVKAGVVLRLVSDNKIELVGDSIGEYSIRYLRKLRPIILEDLSGDGLYIGTDEYGQGYTGPLECELPEAMHRAILLRAVTLAKTVWSTK